MLWDYQQFFNEASPPAFQLTASSLADSTLAAQCQMLAELPFERALRVFVTSLPALSDNEWQQLRQHLMLQADEQPVLQRLWHFSNLFEHALTDIQPLLTQYPLQDAAIEAVDRLQTMSAMERFAFVAGLQVLSHDHNKAQVLFFYLLRTEFETSNMDRMITFVHQLTRRQKDVAALAAYGYTNAEIADQLCIEPSVVAEHLAAVYDKLRDTDPDIPTGAGTRYRLIHHLTRLFEHYPELIPPVE